MKDKHALAGKAVKIRTDVVELGGMEIQIEDYWENVNGMSWIDSVGNPAALRYAARAGFTGLPTDNNVLYGKIHGLGYLVHESELEI